MRKFMNKVLIVLIALVSLPSFAGVDVISAIYNNSTKKIEAQLQFGGCGTPKFKIEWDRGCYETIPLQADGQVVQIAGDDGCERLNQKTVAFTLQGNPCGTGHHLINLKGKGSNNDSIQVEVN